MSTFDQADWLTLSAAVKEYGVPAEFIEQGILYGRLESRRACGARVVRKSEVSALALFLRSGKCEVCGDE
jgi:hypothetical protein